LQLVAEDGDGARADGDAKCGGGGSGSALDVLIKLIRLLAHLAMAADVGRALASRAECGWLVHLLEALSVESAEVGARPTRAAGGPPRAFSHEAV
jgi:hypothetical protein